MLFCATLGILINLLRKHRHLYPQFSPEGASSVVKFLAFYFDT
jgi:hypothetical protein